MNHEIFLRIYGTILFLLLCSVFLEFSFLDKFTNAGNRIASRVRKVKNALIVLGIIGTVVLIWL